MNPKLSFLVNEYVGHLRQLDVSTKGQWGKMNVQQMIEHMTDSFMEANGKIPRVNMTPPERLPAMKDFLMSEKEFRPNTKNALMGEEPSKVRNSSKEEAIKVLEKEIKDFEKYYAEHEEAILTNPFFGNLNFDEWTQLLHKHALHHLKQFGVIP